MNGAYTQLLLQVVRDRCATRMMVRISALLLAGALVVALVVSSLQAHLELMWQAPLGMLTMLIVMWCGAYLKSAVQQNHPAYACLVPQLRRRLIVLTVVLFAACALAVAAMAAAVFGHFGYALVGAGAFFCYILYAQRYTVLAFLPTLIIFGSLSLKAWLAALWQNLAALGEPALAGMGLIAVAALGGAGIQLVFPRGGDRHWAWHARHAALIRRMQGGVLKPEDAGACNRFSMLLRFGYRATLRRDSQRGATQARMLMHTMGPTAYEGGYLAYLLLVTVVAAGVVLYAGADMPAVREMMHTLVMQICLLVAVVLYAADLLKSASRHGAEQALFFLAPRAPVAAQVNRMLGAALLARFLRVWLLACAVAFVVDMLLIGAPRIYGSTFLLAALLLPFSCVLLRDYAVIPASHRQMTTVAWTFVAMLAYLAALAAENKLPELPLFWIGGAIMLVTLLVLRWRWQRLVALPAVLPAGRLLT
ncbi:MULTISPECIES: hypothetical protein [unclassified Duganella]|uniref:hypothetical protein n=1 Tax=unclassified Duganella TaxID=2636909 RepID=UPI000E3497B3|nr:MULTISPECIES: hypothetical protein [unclassified Duganella]RFP19039.1 hypothetical protein D0T23_04445 [Duganella sp. BJB475]RFP35701.1 hypothetical protein D0T21_04445 [Duganella sp. BJB476]